MACLCRRVAVEGVEYLSLSRGKKAEILRTTAVTPLIARGGEREAGNEPMAVMFVCNVGYLVAVGKSGTRSQSVSLAVRIHPQPL